jgi:alpha-glucosidase (family GH31 glycosyl hydrolase)
VEDYRGSYPAGAWGEHRSTVHFTGDTRSDWASLAYTVRLTAAEASIGQPWVSHDIGGFKGRHLDDDLYLRWVQAGTFQPVLRLHSHHGDRLPWQYPAVQKSAAAFLRLREALVPYTYSLAWQAHTTGLPLARPLYLDYPAEADAYTHPGQYLFGPDVLVAPVTRAGRTARQQVWFPPGEWTDFFTGRRHTGPGTETLAVPLDRMPVFVRSGAVIPRLPGSERVQPHPTSLALTVYSGARPGRFTLHTDEGEGSGYREGRVADTDFGYTPADGSSRVDVAAARGSYPGMPAARSYDLEQVNVTAPDRVSVDGREIPRTSAGGPGEGWWHDSRRNVLHVRTGALATDTAHVVEQVGGRRP